MTERMEIIAMKAAPLGSLLAKVFRISDPDVFQSPNGTHLWKQPY
jgi:hypothetical protein